MKQVLNYWSQLSLINRIVIGMIIGILLGIFVPQAAAVGTIGTVFVSALKAIAPLLVFFIVLSALAQHKEGHETNMKSIVILYLFGTFAAALVGVLASFAFPITLTLTDSVSEIKAPEGIASVLQTLILKIVDNPVNALMSGNYIGILSWAVIFGFAFRKADVSMKSVLQQVADATSHVVKVVISCAPFGIMGLVYTTVSENGVGVFASYGELIMVLLGSMFFVALVVNPIIVFFMIKENPYPIVFRCLKDSGITAFFTRSSAANIPVNMELCRDLGLDEDSYSVSIPLGATINMDGTAVYMGVCALFVANVYGVPLTMNQMIMIMFTGTLASIGTAGVPGGGLIMLAMVLQSANLPLEGIALVAGIDRVLDMFRTTLNITGDAAVAVAVDHSEKSSDKELIEKMQEEKEMNSIIK